MQKKREDKNKKLQDELRDLQSIESGKQQGHLDLQGFREEISNRGFRTGDDLAKRIA
jgi:hypothetical protein